MVNRISIWLKLIIALFFFMMLGSCLSMLKFTGGTGKLKLYSFNRYSKKEVNKAIQCLYKKYPQYRPSEKYKNTMIHFYSDLNTPESRRFNNDTVQFHFCVKTIEGDEILFWTAFVGLEKEWLNKPFEFGLRGYKKNDEKLLIQENFKKKEIKKDQYVKLFETEILLKIQEYLTKEGCN